MTEQEMIDEVYSWLEGEAEEFRDLFVSSTKSDLIKYHTTLGRSIRDNFELWETKWEPLIENKVDVSPDHPDQVSMRIIQAVWQRAQGVY